jgi:RNA-directed DNA polymerase
MKARAAKDAAEAILGRLKLRLHPDKTRIVNPSKKGETFTFLGCTHKKARSWMNPKRVYLYRWPSPKSVQRLQERVKEWTDPRRHSGASPRDLLTALRPILLGWAAYFRTGNASPIFAKLEQYVLDRLNLFLRHRSQRAPRLLGFPEARRLGLPRLQGTIRYPGGAHARTG